MRRHSIRASVASAALATLLLGACAPAAGAKITGPSPEKVNVSELPAGSPMRSKTLERNDQWLRHLALYSTADTLAGELEDGSRRAPKDALLRSLQRGLALHEAGQYEASNAAFEFAEQEADLRYSKSVSQMGLSMLTNDAAMDYMPSRAEMAMIPYYRTQNYLRLGDVESAVVEARKASTRMQQLETSTGDICRSSTFLKYMAGLVYEMGGEANDAAVSLRQAEKGYAECTATYGFGVPEHFGRDLHRIAKKAGLNDVAAEASKRYQIKSSALPKGEGEVVIVLENGFVAHRTSQSLYIPILDSDVAGVNGKNPLEVMGAAVTLSGRVVNTLIEKQLWGMSFEDVPAIRLAEAAAGIYVMEISWPSYRLEANRAGTVVARAGETVASATPVQDISAEVVRDYETTRLRVITRSVGRGITKYVTSQALEKQVKKQNPLLGTLTGIAANLAGNALEKADTRSWSLLPDQLVLARLQLPEGEHEIEIEVKDEDGTVLGTESLGTVQVHAGKITMLNHRVWGTSAGERERLIRATKNVTYDELVDPKASESVPEKSGN